MRSAFLTKISFVVFCLSLAAHSQPPTQAVNPHTQIRWPINCNNDPHMAYNWQNNTCVHVGPVGNSTEVQLNYTGSWYSTPQLTYDPATNTLRAVNLTVTGTPTMALPPTQVTWPGSCTTGVYSPAGNTCVAPGTASNAAGATGELQYNTGGGIFGAVRTSSVDSSGNVTFPNAITTKTGMVVMDSPSFNAASGYNDWAYFGCTNTVTKSFGGLGSTSAQGFANLRCMNQVGKYLGPGWDAGTPGFGPTGWTAFTHISDNAITNSPGISSALVTFHYKAGIGDTSNYFYNYNYGGAVAGSDEGNHQLGLAGGESSSVYVGTVTTGGANATTLKVACTADCAYPGDGRFLIDMASVQTVTATANTAATATVPGTKTIVESVTPSTFWGTLSANVVTPIPVTNTTGTATSGSTTLTVASATGITVGSAVTGTGIGTGAWITAIAGTTLTMSVPTTAAISSGAVQFAKVGVATTPMTFSVASGPGNTGSPAIGDLVCFAGTFHEQSIISSVSGTGPWTITVPLRHQHAINSWIMSNGTCGKFFEFTANTQHPTSQDIRFPFDIVGATDAHTLRWTKFATNGPLNSDNGVFFAFTLGSGSIINNGAGLVTFTQAQLYSQHPEFFGQATITIAGTSTAFDGPCTSTVSNASQQLTCTQTASNGLGTIAVGSATIAIGASQYGNTAGKIYDGAEVLDVLDYTTSPPSVSPGNVTTFTLEPNHAAWATSDGIENVHHYAAIVNSLAMNLSIYNPNQFSKAPISLALVGAGINGGSELCPTCYAAVKIANQNPWAMYGYHGGTLVPPGGIYLGGVTNQSLYKYGLAMQYAPDPPGSSMLYAGCPASGCTDAAYTYNLFFLNGNAGSAFVKFTPNTNTLAWVAGMMDYNSAPVTRMTAQSFANGQTAQLILKSIDSGAVTHQYTIAAPVTGTGSTWNLPASAGTWTFAGINSTGASATAGFVSLASGTATVTTTAACTVAAVGCFYSLSNCGPAGTAIGVPSLGTVTVGTSFVINSISATNTVTTGDTSKICWSIN